LHRGGNQQDPANPARGENFLHINRVLVGIPGIRFLHDCGFGHAGELENLGHIGGFGSGAGPGDAAAAHDHERRLAFAIKLGRVQEPISRLIQLDPGPWRRCRLGAASQNHNGFGRWKRRRWDVTPLQ